MRVEAHEEQRQEGLAGQAVNQWEVREGDVLARLAEMPDESVQCVVTSPPFWGLRDYQTATWEGGDPACEHRTRQDPHAESSTLQGNKNTVGHQREGFKDMCPRCGARRVDHQIGLESSPYEYVSRMTAVFAEVRRVLRRDGTLWLNLGDCYATGAGKVGEHPGGGRQGEKWVGDRQGNEGKHAYRTDWAGRGGRPRGTRPTGQNGVMNDGRQKRPPIGPMTQANRMPIEGLKPKDLVGMPWRVAFALQADGWWLRSPIVWNKPNPMPESVEDRPTSSYEFVFFMTRNGCRTLWWRAKDSREWSQHPNLKQKITGLGGKRIPRWRGFDYWYDADAISEDAVGKTTKRPDGWASHSGDHGKFHKDGREKGAPTDPDYGPNRARMRAGFNARWDKREGLDLTGKTRNRRNVWTISTQPFPDAHFATFPENLVKPCILAGTKQGDLVLDPFAGSGTTGVVARKLDRRFVGIELNPEYCEMARKRIGEVAPLLDAAGLH